MVKKLLILTLFICTQYAFGYAEPILITESTISLNLDESEELFFSFAEGDIIKFDLEMIKGRHIKEIEITELPSNKIFSDFKTTGFSKKQIQIRNKGLYKFRFYSSSITRRVCKIKIYRIPGKEETKDFNTNWRWETVRDTIYTPYTIDSITGYRTVKYKETIKELVNTENIENLLFNKSQKVNSILNPNQLNSTGLRVDLPNPINTDLKEIKTTAWAYWIGVGQEGQEAYKQNVATIGNRAAEVASISGNPLTSLAMGTITDLAIPTTGEDVTYAIIPDYENIQNFVNNLEYSQYDGGKGKAAYGKNSYLTQGTFYIGLRNGNQMLAIDVDVKVVAIQELKTYEYNTYDREREDPITVTLDKIRMTVNETKIRVPVE